MYIKLKLKQVLDTQEISRYELSKRSGVGYPTVDSYYKDKVQRYDGGVLAKFCEVLSCDISDLLECVED